MNCSDFETIIIEIARDRLMDAATRERGLEHIRRCAPCATLLVEERSLSRDLRALSARCAAEGMPERIETALLAAFRQREAAPAVAPRRRRWLLAVAALALLTFGISLAGWIASSPKREAPTPGPTDGRASLSIIDVPAPPGKSDRASPRIVEAQKPDRRIPGPTSAGRQKRLASANRRPSTNDAPREYVTPFFPVMQGGELIPLESGQLVRVRMQRSTLIPLGIPLDQGRASETIKADVLLSNDGLARAIRLVY
jgi:hypothetical protein